MALTEQAGWIEFAILTLIGRNNRDFYLLNFLLRISADA